MSTDSEKFITIGIECESIEGGPSWGVGRFLYKTLEQLSLRPQLAATHRFHLYFKKQIPDYPFLASPMFVKTVTTPRWVPASFNLHYHVWMIARAYWDGVQLLFFPNYMLPLMWFKKSLVMLTEDIWYEMRNPKLGFRYRLAYWIFGNWAAIAATRVMAISHSSKEALTKLFGIRPGRIQVNELAVDPPQAVHGLTRTQPYLLYVGQAFERRHLRETLTAFAHIKPQFPGLEFVFVGPDKYTPPLTLDPSVVRFERVSDRALAALYANASVLVYVSDMEAFGLPPLEALSYGVPAVVMDAPVNREIYGEYAFYTQNAQGISVAISTALMDTAQRERIKQAAGAIVARYTWPAHTDRFLTIIHELSHP